MIGSLLDHRYQVIRVLAKGGFGQTYIAQDTRRPGNPICVVKHLKPVSPDPTIFRVAQRLFKSEAESLETLGNHDQIPRLLAYFDDNQEFYLVQEYIEGHTLAEEITPGQRWAESKVVQLLQEILGILEFVHAQGVIHRDIKPDNIIRRQSDHRLVLVDFGAVKQLRTPMVSASGETSYTVAIGTPGYMPTEQGQGKPRPNSDIYSLGIIAIQALTGAVVTDLQEDPQTGEIMWEHLAGVSYSLAAVINKMVRYHFKERYQTATEALEACNRMAHSILSLATPEILAYKPASPSLSVAVPQKTLAVAPGNPAVKPKSKVKSSNKPDPWPFLIGLLLAGAAAGIAGRFYPGVMDFSGLNSGNTLTRNCLAVLAENSNVRSEPTSIDSDNILQILGEKGKFEVTGKRTKKGWVEVKLKSGRLAWAHSDVITNNREWLTCLRDKNIATNIVDDADFITFKPIPQKPAVKVETQKTEKIENTAPAPVPPQKPAVKVKTQKTEKIENTAPAPTAEDEGTKIMEQAKKKYDSGDLAGAISLLQSIPGHASSSIRETATMINQWQQDWAKAEAVFNDINRAVDNNEWEKVLDYQKHTDKLPNTEYWRQKIQPLFQEAVKNLSKQVDSENQAAPKTVPGGKPATTKGE